MITSAKNAATKAAVDTAALVGGVAFCGWCTAKLAVRFTYEHPLVVAAGAAALPSPAGVVVAGAAGIGVCARVYTYLYDVRIGRGAGFQS